MATSEQIEAFRVYVPDPDVTDDEIDVFFSSARDSVLRAVGNYYLAQAGVASATAKSVKDFDLAVDLKERYKAFLATAQDFFNQAESEESNNFFVVIDSPGSKAPYSFEAAPIALL